MAIVTTAPGVDIWYDISGADGAPVVLLAGAANQAIQWEPAFIDPIVDAGHQVVRFDWRDVGLSTWRSYRDNPYTALDLANDVLGVIDDVARQRQGFERVHLLGFSMGGLIAQFIAGLHPDRVRSLATLSAGFAGDFIREDTPRRRQVWSFFTTEKVTSDDELGPFLVRHWRLMCGPAAESDESVWEERIASWLARGQNRRCPHLFTPSYELSTGEWIGDPDRRTEVVRSITCPTLVLHGDDDGMFTPGNAGAIADAVPQAEVHLLPGRGHDLFAAPLAPVHELLLAHLAAT